MGGFGDYAFIAILALLLFGPKKLPVLARQLGKLMADFRRASNEFRTQMEEELRISEQADRQKQITAIEAAAPKPALEAPADAYSTPPENHSDDPHVTSAAPALASTGESEIESPYPAMYPPDSPTEAGPESVPTPLPIATSGELSIMPPATGLPQSHLEPANTEPHALPDPPAPSHESVLETETLHG